MFCPNPDCPDRSETGHASEYRDDVQTCPVCGTPLEHGSWEDLERREPSMPRHPAGAGQAIDGDVELLRTRSVQEADVVAAALEEESIPFLRRVEGPDGSLMAAGVAVVMPGMEQVLLVSEAHARRARALAEDVLRAEPVFDGDDPFGEAAAEAKDVGGDEGARPPGVVVLVVRVVVLALLALGFVAVVRMVLGSG